MNNYNKNGGCDSTTRLKTSWFPHTKDYELKEDCGKIVSFYEDNTPLLLICAVSSEDDYYYVCLEKNMKFHYETCVSKYSIIDDEKIITEMKEWQKENMNEIKNAIYKKLFGRFDVPFTDFSNIFKEN